MSSLEFSEVTVRYGRREVVRRFRATVASGGWLGLIGPNGAGKSSLLRAAVGLVGYTGEIQVDDVSLSLRSRSGSAGPVACGARGRRCRPRRTGRAIPARC